jgi:hypothetical protein
MNLRQEFWPAIYISLQYFLKFINNKNLDLESDSKIGFSQKETDL